MWIFFIIWNIIMQLTQEQLDQYKKIYFDKYWVEISDSEALKQ